MAQQRKGLLEGINVKLEKSDGENLKKIADAAKSILDSIGSSASASGDAKK
jgi:hypothetical protein